MTISVGSEVPSGTLRGMDSKGVYTIKVDEHFKNKK